MKTKESAQLARSLLAMLENPEPGLFSWQGSVYDTYMALGDALGYKNMSGTKSTHSVS